MRSTAKCGERDVVTHLFFDRDNGSSIASCIAQARENGRIVRTALTTQIWDALNGAFGELTELRAAERSKLDLSDLVDWTMRTTALVHGTMERRICATTATTSCIWAICWSGRTPRRGCWT